MIFSLCLEAQSIYFNFSNGTNASYNLLDVSKITFSSDVMNLQLHDGTIYTWNVSTIEHYEYDVNPVNIEPLLNEVNSWDLQLFPNPTSDEIKLKYNLPKDDVIIISIYDLTGKVLLEKIPEKKYRGENQDILHLSQLAPGTYICRIIGEFNSISKQIIKR